MIAISAHGLAQNVILLRSGDLRLCDSAVLTFLVFTSFLELALRLRWSLLSNNLVFWLRLTFHFGPSFLFRLPHSSPRYGMYSLPLRVCLRSETFDHMAEQRADFSFLEHGCPHGPMVRTLGKLPIVQLTSKKSATVHKYFYTLLPTPPVQAPGSFEPFTISSRNATAIKPSCPNESHLV